MGCAILINIRFLRPKPTGYATAMKPREKQQTNQRDVGIPEHHGSSRQQVTTLSEQGIICPACGHANNMGKDWLAPTTRTQRNVSWMRCCNCRSFYLNESYSVEAEMAHVAYTGWGAIKTGIIHSVVSDCAC